MFSPTLLSFYFVFRFAAGWGICDSEWIYVPSKDSCVFTPVHPIDWTSAIEFCSEHDAHLPLIRNQSDVEVFKGLLQRSNPKFYNWIGLSRPIFDANFTWTDGEDLDQQWFLNGEPLDYGNCIAWALSDSVDGWMSINCEYHQFFLVVGTVLTDQFGEFRSEGWPEPYKNSSKELFYIKGSDKSRILIQFDQVDTEKTRDVVVVRDGYADTDRTLAKLSGSMSGVNVVTSGPEALVEFTSDEDTQLQGFHASYKFLEPAELIVSLEEEASIESTNYPRSPDSFQFQDYLIKCDADHHVVFRIIEAKLERGDRLKFYNGHSEKASKLNIINGVGTDLDLSREELRSSSRHLFFSFESGAQTTPDNHWKVEYNCKHDGNLGEEIEI